MINYSDKKALIVEDFAEFARAVGTMLRSMGIVYTDTVTSGEAAIQACRETKYDIILSDYNLGSHKDGQQVLEELSAFNLIKPSCIFIMITAEKNAAMVMAALEFEPDSYLTKPFNSQLLRVRLDKAITKNQMLFPINKALKNKQWPKAYSLCNEISGEHPKYKSSCDKLRFTALLRAKRYDDALVLVNNLLNDRATPWAMNGLGELYYLMDNQEKAESTFKQMISEFPMAIEGYDWLAKIQHQMGQAAEAQQTLESAVNKSPKLITRQKRLALLAEQNKDYETMTNAYRKAVKFGENSAFASSDEYIKLTKSIGKQLKSNTNEDRKKLISEVKSLFTQIEQKFKNCSRTQFRGAVAHADFSAIISDKISIEKYLEEANKVFDKIEEHIGTEESLEIAESLKTLGLNELAECVLEEAVEQYFDNPTFIKAAAKLTSNKYLIENASKANQLNNQAVKLFKQNKYKGAIDYFKQALDIAPNNVNICLNYAQSLLKLFQSGENEPSLLFDAEEILMGITRLSVGDQRYARFSELTRLNQLMIQKLD